MQGKREGWKGRKVNGGKSLCGDKRNKPSRLKQVWMFGGKEAAQKGVIGASALLDSVELEEQRRQFNKFSPPD